MPKLPELFLPTLLLLLLCAGVKGDESAAAPPPDAAILDATALGELPAMVNGRIMPLDTLARTSMLQLAGISTWKYSIPDPENPGETKTVRRPAIDWFAQVLMTPYETRNDKIFLVNFPDVGEALGLEHDGGRMRYSFSDITGSIEKLEEVIRGAIDKEANDRTQLENEMGKLNAALRHFVSYTKAFMYTSEHPSFSFEHEANQNALGLPIKDQYSFVEIFRCSPLISARLANAKPLPKDMTPEDLELFQINQELQVWTQELGQIQFGLLPLQAHGEIVWMNPLQAATIPGAHTVVAMDLEGLS
jgi:hypothetical protein